MNSDLTDKPLNPGPLGKLGRWLGALWPGCCVACGAATPNGDLCRGCTEDLQPNSICCQHCALALAEPALACGRCLRRAPTFDRAWSPWRYAQPLDSVVLKLKFRADLAAGRVLGRLWCEQLSQRPSTSVDLLIPIPLAGDRLRERGYNQALELARPLARQLALPLSPRALSRVRPTQPQSGLDAKARKRNLAGAFLASAQVNGQRVALIDDVMTTGATMDAAAKALKKAGAIEVQAWALARA